MNRKGGKQKPDPIITGIFSTNLRACISTNESLAEEIKISSQSVADYVNGVSLPRADILYKISQAVGRSMEWLLTGQDEIEVSATTPPPLESRYIDRLEKDIDNAHEHIRSQNDRIEALINAVCQFALKGDPEPLKKLCDIG